MSHPPAYAAAASADPDDESPPIFLLSQDVLAPFHSWLVGGRHAGTSGLLTF